jgi:hypothetical protein
MGAIMRDWKNELKKMELKKQDKKENEVIEQKSIRKQFMEYFGEKNHHTNRTEEIDGICIDYSGFGKIIDRTDLGVYKNNERELVLTNFDENMNYTNKFNRKEDFDLNKEHPVLYGVIENIRLKASLENTIEKKEEKSRKLKI